jgi:hypothetical protein
MKGRCEGNPVMGIMRDNVALRTARLDRLLKRRSCWSLPVAVIAAMLAAPAMSGAQPSAAARRMVPQMKAPAAQGTAATTRRKTMRRKAATAAKPATAPAAPPAPPKPQWPVNDPPQQASVGWSAQGLSIEAKNSSLQQILHDIAAQTGVKIEGMDKDERVFGVYGPGQARDVLSELLEGTDYNVLMVGAGEHGAPQQIVLSAKPAGGTQPNAPVPPGEAYEPPMAPYEPPQPVPQQQPQMPPNQAPRTPQQILQEMQQRQLLMQQQMQQQQRQQQQQQ